MTGPSYLLRLMVTITLTSSAHRLSCDPGELFTSHNLTCDLGQSNGSFIWRRNYDEISTCRPSSTSSICIVEKQYKRSYTAYFMNETIVLNIMNVTKETEGNYSCSDESSTVETCDFRVNDRHQDSPKPNGGDVNVGAIVGGILAGILVIVVLVVLILFLRRKVIEETQVNHSTPEDVADNYVISGINDKLEPAITLKPKPTPKPRTVHLCDDRTLHTMTVPTMDQPRTIFIQETKSASD